MQHLFIDCETMSTSEYAVVPMFVALCVKDGQTLREAAKTALFLSHPSVSEQRNLGRAVDTSTMDFWERQDETIRSAVFDVKSEVSVSESAIKFKVFLSQHGFMKGDKVDFTGFIWQRGSKDETWLNSLFEDEQLFLPWWKVRDVRTAVDVLGGSEKMDGYMNMSRVGEEDAALLTKLQVMKIGPHHPVYDTIRDAAFLYAVGILS